MIWELSLWTVFLIGMYSLLSKLVPVAGTVAQATIKNCRHVKGVRKSVYLSATTHKGFAPTPSVDDAFRYDGVDLHVYVVFRTLDQARGFTEELLLWNNIYEGMVSIQRCVHGWVYLTGDRAIYSVDYKPLCSDSPPVSASSCSAVTSSSACLSPSPDMVQFQRIQPIKLQKGAGFERCHIKDSALCTEEEDKDPNNFLAFSHSFHKMFDGRGVRQTLPTVRISVAQIHDDDILVRGSCGEEEIRKRVDLLVEFRTADEYDGMEGVFKDGTVMTAGNETLWTSFVFVLDPFRFEEYITVKYNQTTTKWNEHRVECGLFLLSRGRERERKSGCHYRQVKPTKVKLSKLGRKFYKCVSTHWSPLGLRQRNTGVARTRAENNQPAASAPSHVWTRNQTIKQQTI